ncbi:hypothetical protein [Vulcanisaeta sp. JCM 16161]|uniref:hypothetical protein n=1 Tax=Vulcanisaeta sp. JCM 16161 TaxID=1295372 RepID=UPI0006D0B2FE|nr:hypothetical protein [Vulcanisaeta sp. JCM 16161]
MHLEVIEDLPDVDVVINPIGGGSGASSAVVVYKSINPSIKVVAFRPRARRVFTYRLRRVG